MRNPEEGDTCLRVCFQKASDTELVRFQGFQIPIDGPFDLKPIILMPVKNRNFDYFSQLSNHQVKFLDTIFLKTRIDNS